MDFAINADWLGLDKTSEVRPNFPPNLREVLGVKSLPLGRYLVHSRSLQEFHRGHIA
jgi:hypothetical protein